MKEYRVYQVDAFTKEMFSGNPAGVVSNATGLSDRKMQQIARELNNSETAFLLDSASPDKYKMHTRYFTSTVEVPICGHATIAAYYVWALEQGIRAEYTKLMHKTGAGILPIEIYRDQDDYRIAMTQGTISFEPIAKQKDRKMLMNALNLQASDMDKRCPLEIASTGHSKVMIGIRSLQTLHALKPNLAALAALSKQIGCNGYFVFTLESDDETVAVNGRMFAPAIGINEDPVTGNANGPFGAYAVRHSLLRHDGKTLLFKGKQGEAIGRPGTVHVDVSIHEGKPLLVQVSGYARIVFQTSITL